MFARVKALTFKIKMAIYIVIAIILSLLIFSIYVNVRGVQSVNYLEHQAASTSDMSVLLDQVTQSLRGIEEQLAGIQRETCLARTNGDASVC